MSSLAVIHANHSATLVTEKEKTMSDTYGQTSLTPFAQYDHDTRSWRTSAVTSLWALPMSSLTLPKSGGLVNGELLERPMLAHPTGENVSSSLPTPTARDHKDTTVEIKKHRPEATDSINSALAHLLPTPLTTDYNTPASEWGKEDRLQLRDINVLLPTPAVNDMGAGKDPEAWNEWAAKQKAADGRPAPHGKSLEQEALTMLPTPKATNNENQQNLTDYGPNLGMALMPDQYDWSAKDKLLPTPTVIDSKGPIAMQRNQMDKLRDVTWLLQTGESTPQQSDDGKLF
jgi:hypothetical protein